MRRGLAAGLFSRLRKGFPAFGRSRKGRQFPEIPQIRLFVEVSWSSQNLKVSHAAEMGSKANSAAFPRSLATCRAWDPPEIGMRWRGKELGERRMDISFLSVDMFPYYCNHRNMKKPNP